MTNHAVTRRPRPRVELKERSEHEVGYGKPPSQHRFKPGQSGNPKGRPRGSQNMTTFVHEVLSQKILTRWQGRQRALSVRKAIHLRLVNDALGGNLKTISFLLERFAPQMSPAQEKVSLTVDELIAELKRRNIWGFLREMVHREDQEEAKARHCEDEDKAEPGDWEDVEEAEAGHWEDEEEDEVGHRDEGQGDTHDPWS